MPSIKELLSIQRKQTMAFYGLLLGLSAPGFGLWPLAWLALIPALYWVQRQSSLKSILAGGFWLGFAYHGLVCSWFFDLHPLSWLGFGELESRLVTLAGWLLIAVEGGLLGGMLMVAYAKLPAGRLRALIFPLVWVLGFSMLNWTPMALPWALIEYSQAPVWPLRWLVGMIGQTGLAGGSGLAGLMVLYQTAWAERLARHSDGLDGGIAVVRNTFLTLFIAAMALFWLNGLPYFLAPWPVPWPLPVAVVQADLPIEVIRSGRLDAATIRPAYLDPPVQTALPSGTLLVYPEEGVVPGLVPMAQPQRNAMMAELAGLAEKHHWFIAVGITATDDAGRLYNAIAMLSPEHQPMQFYEKRRLVPFGEFTPYGFGPWLTNFLASLGVDYAAPYASGHAQPLLLHAGPVPIGGLVCFELIDSDPLTGGFAAQARRAGARLLIDSGNLGWFHENPLLEAQFLAIGQMRAAENRLPLVIASNTGTSAVLDGYGTVLTRTDPREIMRNSRRIAPPASGKPQVAGPSSRSQMLLYGEPSGWNSSK